MYLRRKVLYMKSMIIIFFFVTIANILSGQVTEQNRRMSLGEQSALVLEIKDADVKTVETVWKDFFGKFGKEKKNRKADEWYITDAEISPLRYSRTVDLYAQISGAGTVVTVVTWIDMKGGFLSAAEYPKEYPAAVEMLQDFNMTVKRTIIENDLKEQEKLLSRLENEMKKLLRENDNLHKIIEDAKEKIAKAEADIQTNLADQDARKKEIELQKNTIDEVRKRLKNVGK